MVKLSRYFLVIVAVVSFSILLPRLYWMAFAKPVRAPYIRYSCINDNFVILRVGDDVKRVTSDGKELTRDEFEASLPLQYARQLLMNGTMPDTIKGVAIDIHEVGMYRSIFRMKPDELHCPKSALFPLFEAESGRANLELPKDFFRITWRMDFVDAQTNKVNEEKSRNFSAALHHFGFEFPAKSINGLPTTRKSCDEGYFVIDAKDQLFQVKMIKGKPFVRKVELPDDMRFKTIQCVDNKDKLFYAYLISEENDLYVLTEHDYRLVKLDVDDINPDEYQVQIYGDFFNYNIITIGDNFARSQVLDRNYKKIDEYSKTWIPAEDRTEGKIARFLFPAEVSMSDNKSGFINFFFSGSKTYCWLILSLVFIVLQVLIVRKRKEVLKNHILDLCLIAVSGIFGFIAVNIFPNKHFK